MLNYRTGRMPLALALVIASYSVACTKPSPDSSFAGRFAFATPETAAELLGTQDDYTNAWTQFDIESRLQQKGTKADLLAYIKQQVAAWSPAEKETLTGLLHEIHEHIAERGFDLNLPDRITLVKTTGAEEGGAVGYTRSNYIVITERALPGPRNDLKRLLIHELCHILSRHDPAFRESLYGLIGFQVIAHVDTPDALSDRRLTNPDAVSADHMIEINVDGESVAAQMILYSDRDYTGGSLFEYLNIGFMELAGADRWQAKLIDGRPLLHSLDEVSGFSEKIGRNTRYTIHPEEIMAENFVDALLATPAMPSPEIIKGITAELSSP